MGSMGPGRLSGYLFAANGRWQCGGVERPVFDPGERHAGQGAVRYAGYHGTQCTMGPYADLQGWRSICRSAAKCEFISSISCFVGEQCQSRKTIGGRLDESSLSTIRTDKGKGQF